MNHRSRELSVCIIGLGSRGLGVLERVTTLAAESTWRDYPVRVEIVDPAGSGSGMHSLHQPDYLLLNTMCSEISHFPNRATVGSSTGDGGPDLHTWATQRGLRLAEDGVTVGFEGRRIRPEDFLPRRLLGEYLAWFLERTLARAPNNVSVHRHRATAVDVDDEPDGLRSVALSDGRVLRTRYVFLTAGHTPNISAGFAGSDVPAAPPRVIHDVYPLPDSLTSVRADATVALAGTGLSAMDVIASLTRGRGGCFEQAPHGLRYVCSGAEPRILLYTRSGLPFRARPADLRPDDSYEPVAFHRPGVDRARAHAPLGQLDLRRHVLPLVQAEMRVAYHHRRVALHENALPARDVVERLRTEHSRGRLKQALDRLDRQSGTAFSPGKVLFGEVGGLEGSGHYQRWYASRVGDDLVEAHRGLGGSPLKSALEVLREQREIVRYAVDFGGLDERSHAEFYGSFAALLNRMVTGPQRERHAELLALIEAGVVSLPFGPVPKVTWDEPTGRWMISSTRLTRPHAEHTDWLCRATSGQPDVERSADPLVTRLVDAGRLRRHRPTVVSSRGVDLTPEHHPVNRDGRPDERMWVLGPLCEGTTFYNHYVPSPHGFSRALCDTHRYVAAMFASAAKVERQSAGLEMSR